MVSGRGGEREVVLGYHYSINKLKKKKWKREMNKVTVPIHEELEITLTHNVPKRYKGEGLTH